MVSEAKYCISKKKIRDPGSETRKKFIPDPDGKKAPVKFGEK
jgi:hypothetical protein